MAEALLERCEALNKRQAPSSHQGPKEETRTRSTIAQPTKTQVSEVHQHDERSEAGATSAKVPARHLNPLGTKAEFYAWYEHRRAIKGNRKIDDLMVEEYGEAWRIRNTLPENPADWKYRYTRAAAAGAVLPKRPLKPWSKPKPKPVVAPAPEPFSRIDKKAARERYWASIREIMADRPEDFKPSTFRTSPTAVPSASEVQEQNVDSLDDKMINHEEWVERYQAMIREIVPDFESPAFRTSPTAVPSVSEAAEQNADSLEDTMIDHEEWASAIEGVEYRSQQEQQQEQEPETEHSTGSTTTKTIERVFTSVKGWCSRAWTAVKTAIWG